MSRRRRRYFASPLIALAVLALVWHFRAPLLAGMAKAWIVNDPPSPCGAIVVLGGGIQTRPFEAARLYREGYAPRVLVASPERKPTDELGITAGDTETTTQILLEQGVPEQSIIPFGNEVSSTFEEALALRDWVEKTGAKKLIIVSDPFHTRRARWLFRKQLSTTSIQILTVAAPALKYDASNWWQTEQGLIEFQNELIKYIFYRLKYSGDTSNR
jgi:uncharacterized SAM-binding protein YcdF (DUF218 family)